MSKNAFVFMGGTFDPIHNGHLRTALEMQQWLGVDRLHLIPSKTPVHKDAPGCTSAQRLEMVRLAVEGESVLQVDEREINSVQPSYTLLTLQGLRAELGDAVPICMIMGMDAYQTLPSWHEWQRFLTLGHLIVVQRPGYQLADDSVMGELTRQHCADSPQELLSQPSGKVLLHELTPLGISATQVRETIGSGDSPRYLIPDPVWQYIQENQLYGLTN
ncbi:MAG: nicotinate-nucleotide adenylyltransferase [Neptuniibacter sp.]